jgi:hypothetical protein
MHIEPDQTPYLATKERSKQDLTPETEGLLSLCNHTLKQQILLKKCSYYFPPTGNRTHLAPTAAIARKPVRGRCRFSGI